MAGQLAKHLADKIDAMPESGMLFWRVTLRMADGSAIRGVICCHNGVEHDFMVSDGSQVDKSQILDVEWEGQGRPDWIKSR
jgi:hypothetical protein